MLTNADMPADAAYALAGVYLNPGLVRVPCSTAAAGDGATAGDGIVEEEERDPQTMREVKVRPAKEKAGSARG